MEGEVQREKRFIQKYYFREKANPKISNSQNNNMTEKHYLLYKNCSRMALICKL